RWYDRGKLHRHFPDPPFLLHGGEIDRQEKGEDRARRFDARASAFSLGTSMSTTAQQSATIESGRTMPSESIRTGSSVAELKDAFLNNVFCALGRLPKVATRQDAYTALALTVRDRV